MTEAMTAREGEAMALALRLEKFASRMEELDTEPEPREICDVFNAATLLRSHTSLQSEVAAKDVEIARLKEGLRQLRIEHREEMRDASGMSWKEATS